jgi:hypothetical protein
LDLFCHIHISQIKTIAHNSLTEYDSSQEYDVSDILCLWKKECEQKMHYSREYDLYIIIIWEVNISCLST